MTGKTPGPAPNDSLKVAEYALGVLPGPEREAFSKRLAQEPVLQSELRAWDEHFAAFADAVEAVPPPRQVLARLEQRLFAGSAAEKPSLWNSLGVWRGLAVASLAGVIAIGAWNFMPRGEGPAAPGLVAQVQGTGDQVKLVAFYDAAKGELRLNRIAGTAAAGRSFELWLIAGQEAPVSLGVLPAQNTDRLVVPVALREKMTGGVLAISDEPEGGSPTGQATGTVLATGQFTAI